MDTSSLARHLLAGRYFQLAALVMLAYDHILTLGQEIERIWMRRISYASVLFLLNRYATLIAYIVIVVSFNDPGWRGEAYALFEGTCSVILTSIGQTIMILRVVALYNRSKKVFAFLSVLWAGQFIISIVGLMGSFALSLPPGLIGCILTGTSNLDPSLWITPLVTDSVIFFLTIYRTRHNISDLVTLAAEGKAFAADKAITILLRDGIIYYFLIFLANLMNALIFFLTQPELKQIGAAFSGLLTCTVISRLVLNLRSLSSDNQGRPIAEQSMSLNGERLCFQRSMPTSKKSYTIWTRTLDDFTENESLVSRSVVSGDISVQQVETTHHG